MTPEPSDSQNFVEFIGRLKETAMLAKFPRRHRLIFDMDGMYNPIVKLDGYDFNHRTQAESNQWIEHYDALADWVAKPTLAPPDRPRVRPMIFYGYDPALEVSPAGAPPKASCTCTTCGALAWSDDH